MFTRRRGSGVPFRLRCSSRSRREDSHTPALHWPTAARPPGPGGHSAGSCKKATSLARDDPTLKSRQSKDVPLLEDRPPGGRVLVGAGRVLDVGPSVEWSYEGEPGQDQLRCIMWERSLRHSIRPGFADGFLLPYQEILANPDLAGEDLSRFVAQAPSEHFDEFSYVTELVGNDGAIAALLELARVVELLPTVADGPWETVAGWLSERLADAWKMRGPYPGLGAALGAAGFECGALITHRVVDGLEDPEDDPWPQLDRAIREGAEGRGPAAGLVGRMARQLWERIFEDDQRRRFLKLVARFPLTVAQARRFFDPQEREQAGIDAHPSDFLNNPYLFYEVDRGRDDSVSLRAIDRSLFPRSAKVRTVLDDSLLPEPVTERNDDRRVRAACTDLLETAASQGSTLLDEAGLRRRLSSMEFDPPCDPPTQLFELAAEGFEPVLRPTDLAEGRGRGWQLARLSEASNLIADEVERRVQRGRLEANWDWRRLVDDAIPEAFDSSDAAEEEARAEKARALQALAQSRISALIGPAGTGKTTLLAALCSQPDVEAAGVLLVAPTGKARVQLQDSVGVTAKTLAQFLYPERWDQERGYHSAPEAAKVSGYGTVVVDEASMLDEEMLGALLDAVEGVDRLVLCGDHRQLPPIGPGLPFSDLIRYLDEELVDNPDFGGGLAKLSVGRRQRPSSGEDEAGTGRDDLAIASLFSIDGSLPTSDQALATVLQGEGDGTIEIIPWQREQDLHRELRTFLSERMGIELGSAEALRVSLGATEEINGRMRFKFGEGGSGSENWQLLSPVRSREGGVSGLNRLVRNSWREGNASLAHRSNAFPPPMGADEILFNDKVMCVRNHRRDAWLVEERDKVDAVVANGEIGIAVHWPRRRGGQPNGLTVEFSTQPGSQFTFWGWELNGKSIEKDVLDLAYAITIHKSQGSQFVRTLVVVPNPSPLLCPELLYTALTRHREKTTLFVQGDPQKIREFGEVRRSETARRLTSLFRPADPFEGPNGETFDGSHVHRTSNGELVCSKSEVIVAETLRRVGIPYEYEKPLVMSDGTERLPDFTINISGKPTIYWEHLGLLGKAGYRADWEAKKSWYAQHGILPWRGGGGERGILVWSEDSPEGRIDASEIEEIARLLLG